MIVLLVLVAAVPMSIAIGARPPKGDESISAKAAARVEEDSQPTVVTPAKVIAAWQEREKRATAFRFNRRQKSTTPKGSRRTLGNLNIPGGKLR